MQDRQNKRDRTNTTIQYCTQDSTIWLAIFPIKMVLRLNIDRIELATRDWICKVQIVEIGCPRESPDKKCRFQNFILEDEEECQIKAVMYAGEIEQYADKPKLINTYLISAARVKVSPTSYGKPIHKFYWILDKETVIEHIKPSNELGKPLPPPTKLNITAFDRIPHLMVDSAAEIGRINHRCREITLCDNQKNHFLLTLCDEDQSDTTSRRPFTRSQAKDLQALQALWMKMEPLEGTNMKDLKIFNILSALPF